MTDPRLIAEARKHFLQGHSLKSTCELYNLSYPGLSRRCTREGWKAQRDKIEASQSALSVKLTEESVRKTSDLASSLASKQIADHLTAMITGSISFRDKLLANVEQIHLPACLDHQTAEQLARTVERVDTTLRRSMGLSDAPQELKLSGSIESTMNILASCQAIQAKGDAVPAVDVESLLIEAKASESK